MEHLTQQQLGDYSQNRLSAADLLSISDHLGACEVCRRGLEAINGDATFFALHAETVGADATLHLTPEQTAEYVDRNLSGEALQIVNDHLSNCEQCVFAVEDLRAFRNEIAPSLEREYQPAAVPGRAESWWRRGFASLPSLFRVSPVPAFGTAALAIILLGVVGYIVWRTPNETGQEIVVAPTPSTLPSPSAEPSPPQPQAAPVVAQLNDGSGVVTLDQEGKLSGADNLPPSYQSLLKKAISSQRIERSSQLEGLTRPSSSLMGSNENREFSVLEPVGNVLLSNQPTFRWSRMEGANGYVVEIYDEQFKLVASSPQQNELSWTTTLARGMVYSWQVKAIKEGQEITSPRPPAPQAKFRVLGQEKANELARAKRAYGSSHLTLGLLYAEAGLLREAEQEFRLLRRANPDSEVARNLLRQVQAMRVRSQ